jgi:hypothetical protein
MPPSTSERSRIRAQVVWTAAGSPCLRCDQPAHTTQSCTASLDVCWEGFSDRVSAEEFYQAERKKTEVRLAKRAAEQAVKKSTNASASRSSRQTPKSTNEAPVVDPMAVTTRQGANREDAGMKQRQPIPDDKVGQVDRLIVNPAVHAHSSEPKGANQALHAGKTDNIDGKLVRTPAVIANYVRATHMPNQLYAYSLRFYREHWTTKGAVIDFNKSGEVKNAFEAFLQSKQLDLTGVLGATDYKELWCTTALPIPDGLTFHSIGWNCPGRRGVDGLSVDIGTPKRMDIFDAFSTRASCDLSDEIRALNAIISSAVRLLRTDLIQVEINQYFVKDAYQVMADGLRAQRGYFTSIRPSVPGPLLNVNTATTTFFPPVLVPEFLERCKVQCALGNGRRLSDLSGTHAQKSHRPHRLS